MSDTYVTIGKVNQIQVHPVGSMNLEFDVDIAKEAIADVLLQHSCIFRFEVLEYDAKTQKGKIIFVPDNGMVRVLATGEPVGRKVQ